MSAIREPPRQSEPLLTGAAARAPPLDAERERELDPQWLLGLGAEPEPELELELHLASQLELSRLQKELQQACALLRLRPMEECERSSAWGPRRPSSRSFDVEVGLAIC